MPAETPAGSERQEPLWLTENRKLSNSKTTALNEALAYVDSLKDSLTTAQKELAAYKGTEGFLPGAYKNVHKFFECWPGGLDEVEASIAGHKRVIEAAQKERDDARIANDEINAARMKEAVRADYAESELAAERERREAAEASSVNSFALMAEANDSLSIWRERADQTEARAAELEKVVRQGMDIVVRCFDGAPERAFMDAARAALARPAKGKC